MFSLDDPNFKLNILNLKQNQYSNLKSNDTDVSNCMRSHRIQCHSQG